MKVYLKEYTDEVITEAEARQREMYRVSFIDDTTGLPKRIYTVTNFDSEGLADIGSKELINVAYYLDDGEDEHQIVSLYADKGIFLSVIKRTVLGDKTLEYVKEYTEGDLNFVSNYLRDEFGNNLCDQNIDKETGEPIVGKTEKCFYDYSEYSSDFGYQPLFKAEYNADGSLAYIYYTPDPQNEQDNEGYTDLDKFQLLFNEDLNYYRTADLLPKENN